MSRGAVEETAQAHRHNVCRTQKGIERYGYPRTLARWYCGVYGYGYTHKQVSNENNIIVFNKPDRFKHLTWYIR